jgi:hypothetical protein
MANDINIFPSSNVIPLPSPIHNPQKYEITHSGWFSARPRTKSIYQDLYAELHALEPDDWEPIPSPKALLTATGDLTDYVGGLFMPVSAGQWVRLCRLDILDWDVSIILPGTADFGVDNNTIYLDENNKLVARGGGSGYVLPVATPSILGGVKPDNTTITATPDGVISATGGTPPDPYTLPTASQSVLGGVKIDGTSISIASDGTISSQGGGGGYAPDGSTIELVNDQLHVKDATGTAGTETTAKIATGTSSATTWYGKFINTINGIITALGAKYVKPESGIPASDIESGVIPDVSDFVRTSGAQAVAGVKTFSDTDVHSAGIQITGSGNRIEMEGQNGGTIDGGCVKLCFHANTSDRTPGAGGDLSLILYGTGTHPSDMGLGITPNSLNIKAGGGSNAIHLLNGTKHLAIFGDSGVRNVVLVPQESATVPVTDTTEIGIKAFRTSSLDIGLEMRLNATNVVQFRFNTVAHTGGVQKRETSDNGATWSNWGAIIGYADEMTAGLVKVEGVSIMISEDGYIEARKATATTYGIVKADGTSTTIDENGIIHAAGGDPYTLPIATDTVLGGVKVDGATIQINGETGTIKVPTAYAAGGGGLGLVKPDGISITVDNDGLIKSVSSNLMAWQLIGFGPTATDENGEAAPTAGAWWRKLGKLSFVNQDVVRFRVVISQRNMMPGGADGIVVDVDFNIWVAARDPVTILGHDLPYDVPFDIVWKKDSSTPYPLVELWLHKDATSEQTMTQLWVYYQDVKGTFAPQWQPDFNITDTTLLNIADTRARATATTYGIVKADNTTIKINAAGVISTGAGAGAGGGELWQFVVDTKQHAYDSRYLGDLAINSAIRIRAYTYENLAIATELIEYGIWADAMGIHHDMPRTVHSIISYYYNAEKNKYELYFIAVPENRFASYAFWAQVITGTFSIVGEIAWNMPPFSTQLSMDTSVSATQEAVDAKIERLTAELEELKATAAEKAASADLDALKATVAAKYDKPTKGIPDKDMENAPLKLGRTSTTAMPGDTVFLSTTTTGWV